MKDPDTIFELAERGGYRLILKDGMQSSMESI